MDAKSKLGTLVLLRVDVHNPRGGTLELLLTLHFPILEVTQSLAAPATALRAGRSDWKLAATVVTYRRVEWAIDYFTPYKSPGMDGIFPAL
jgi:hypothetical protein